MSLSPYPNNCNTAQVSGCVLLKTVFILTFLHCQQNNMKIQIKHKNKDKM